MYACVLAYVRACVRMCVLVYVRIVFVHVCVTDFMFCMLFPKNILITDSLRGDEGGGPQGIY